MGSEDYERRCFFFGFVESQADPSVFMLVMRKIKVHICVYVDDLIVIGSDEAEVKKTISSLSQAFPIRDLG